MSSKLEQFMYRMLGSSSGGDEHGDGSHSTDSHSEFGVHIQYTDLYNGLLFLVAIYAGGQLAQRLLRMPSLVGEIFVGILLGPPLADFVPIPEAWVLLGELGLILLVIEAGIDIDLDTLKLIGSRGFLIAFLGSIFPIALGLAIAFSIGLETKAAIAAGASFGPTSLGIALNILKSGGVLNTPVGQLIVAAAVIDDMIALVVLSQLQALTGSITAQGILIPVVSALLFLFVGGYIAVYILPKLIDMFILTHVKHELHGKVELGILLVMLLILMPATYYAEASYLMGAFIAGLTFCTSHALHDSFVLQFKRLLQWLMRIFFAASIGFQVPIKEFGSTTIIWQGLYFTAALLGKLAAGFLVPNFSHDNIFKDTHLRDCLITGFSLAAEGEFAFVIAVFGVDSGLISKETYSSIVLAVLLSTIVPPFLLRFTITHWNKKAQDKVRQAAEIEANRKKSDVETTRPDDLAECIMNQTAVFMCIQTQSHAAWGLMMNILNSLRKNKLEVIDHRSWHPRGVQTTLVNEIYVRDRASVEPGQDLSDRMKEVQQTLESAINQEEAKVKVTRWFPGIVNEIVEEIQENVETTKKHTRASIEDRLLTEATEALERKRMLQTSATSKKSLHDLVSDTTLQEATLATDGGMLPIGVAKRRTRKKTRSTPVFGGSLFGEESGHHAPPSKLVAKDDADTTALRKKGKKGPAGHSAELHYNGHTYHVRLSDDALKELRDYYRGLAPTKRGVALHGVSLAAADTPVVNMLQGFVRKVDRALSNISEHPDESVKKAGSDTEAGSS